MSTLFLTTSHSSLQFSDTDAQKRADVEAVFKRAIEQHHWWCTGTEAGEEPYISLLRAACRKYGFRLHRWRGNWIAVNRERIVPRTWKTGHIFVAPTSEVYGHGHDSGFPWVNFENIDLGSFAIAAIHYPTKGRRPSDPNYQVNKRYAAKVGEWGLRHGKGHRLAFVQGDFNILDKVDDVFHGNPFTTAWDERKKHPKTHAAGNIDAIASYDKDGRVKAVMARRLTDRQLHLHSDHFYIEAGFQVRLPRGR